VLNIIIFVLVTLLQLDTKRDRGKHDAATVMVDNTKSNFEWPPLDDCSRRSNIFFFFVLPADDGGNR
jgi:hypothetical protein